MCTYCQGARRAIFLITTLLFATLAPPTIGRAETTQSSAPPSVVTTASAPFSPNFVKHDGPVFEGQYIASDPAIVVEDGFLRLFYTCFIVPPSGFTPENVRAGICSATSTDGLHWTEVDSGDPNTPGLVMRGIEGSWQENLEAAFAIEIDDTYLLYFSGYETEGDPALGYPAQLTVASSIDGIHFERVTDALILSPTPGWYDNDAVYSPAVTIAGEQLAMVYAGHCYTNCPNGYGVTLLGAISTDGITWTKLDQPVLQGPSLALDWTKDGVAEPALAYGDDGQWQLYFTALNGDEREIGLATGPTPFGPWAVLDKPVLSPTAGTFDAEGVLAPFVLLGNDLVRMWYLAPSGGEQDFVIGYAESAANDEVGFPVPTS